MDSKQNDGYTPEESILLAGATHILGRNASAKFPYSTWLEIDNQCTDNHYFSSLEDARLDLLKRAINLLPEEKHTQLILSTMDENSRRIIEQQGREEIYLGDIESCLEPVLERLGIDSSQTDIFLKSETFQKQALDLYFRQDHSSENEALSESLENLIQDKYPELLPKNFITTLKLSPEEMELLNDVLSKTAGEVEAIYGAFEEGDGALDLCAFIPAPYGNAIMHISIYPNESPEQENTVELVLSQLAAHSQPNDITDKLTGIKTLEQVFSVTDAKGCTWSVDVHADERLRRIGKEYVFITDSTDQTYLDHNHHPCTVIRQLTAQENDILYSGMMWKVQFRDGTVLDAFDSELDHPLIRKVNLDFKPEQQPPQKLSQDQLIPCEYISVRDNLGEVCSNAKYNPQTNEVCEIEKPELSDEVLAKYEILTGEYMQLHGKRYELFAPYNSARRGLNEIPNLSFLQPKQEPIANLLEDAIYRSRNNAPLESATKQPLNPER